MRLYSILPAPNTTPISFHILLVSLIGSLAPSKFLIYWENLQSKDILDGGHKGRIYVRLYCSWVTFL